jgi:hypothetical protein
VREHYIRWSPAYRIRTVDRLAKVHGRMVTKKSQQVLAASQNKEEAS